MFVFSVGAKNPWGTSPSLCWVRTWILLNRKNTMCQNMLGRLETTLSGLINPPSLHSDTLGSGDDDEDNGLDDSSAEIENDQVYISRGVWLSLLFKYIYFFILKTISGSLTNPWSSMQVRTGLTRSVWRRSCTLFLQATPWSSGVQPWAAPCQALGGSKMDVNSEESTASEALRSAGCDDQRCFSRLTL